LISLFDLLTSGIPQALQFIVETGKSRPKGEALRLIRTQARRRKTPQNSSSKRTPPLLRPKNKAGKTRNASNSAAPRVLDNIALRSPSPNHGSLSNKFEPFNVLPVDERGHSHYLIFQCKLDVYHVSGRKQIPYLVASTQRRCCC
jgi:hypothetical protein